MFYKPGIETETYFPWLNRKTCISNCHMYKYEVRKLKTCWNIGKIVMKQKVAKPIILAYRQIGTGLLCNKICNIYFRFHLHLNHITQTRSVFNVAKQEASWDCYSSLQANARIVHWNNEIDNKYLQNVGRETWREETTWKDVDVDGRLILRWT
jgi:hypothetical protein